MRNEDRFYEVLPKIVPARRESLVTIRPLYDHCRFRQGVTYRITLLPTEGVTGQTFWPPAPRHEIEPVDGIIQISFSFEREQEYALLLESVQDGKEQLVAEFRLYALEPDLFACRPYKGDFHMHTYYSDGKESPAFVAASCRKIGLDFAAITDHRQYAPSLEAISAFEDVDTDLRLYPGEEVHPPDNPVHIVNFGGRFSINELFDTDAYRSEVAAIQAGLSLPQDVDAYPFASCLWCYDKIREAGGLGVFCHPYWLSWHRYDVPTYLTDLLFEHQPFDALEVIGGFFRWQAESNALQVSRYHEERAKGKRIPVVGVSDSHGSENSDLFGWYYTIAFSPSPELDDLITSIKDLRSVAVEAMPGEFPRAHGPFGLTKFAQYCLRELFPLHDELCLEEGRLMQAHVAGDESAAESLSRYKGRTEALYNRLWGAE